MKIRYLIYSLILSMSLVFTNCSDDYLDRTTETNVSDVVVYSSLEGLQSILHGVYRKMYQNDNEKPGFEGMPGKLFMYDSRCEDIATTKSSWIYMDQKLWYAGMNWATTHQNWSFYYNIIINTNHVLDNYENFPEGDQRNFVEGQARTLRAYAYFYLIRLYQHSYAHLDKIPELEGKNTPETAPGVILLTKVDQEGQPRTSVQDCYNLILSDLERAHKIMKGQVRPHKSMINENVVSGLLARVHLEMASNEHLEKARDYAAEARNNHPLMTADDYKAGFNQISNEEWIWGLEIQEDQAESFQSLYNLITDNVPGETYAVYSYYFTMNKPLHDKIAPEDVRYQVFVDDPNLDANWLGNKQIKFQGIKGHKGDHVLMRSAEMLLIQAETNARLGAEDKARQLLKELRDNRLTEGESVLSTNTGQALLDEIYLERRIELWGEGFRFFDLKRLHQGMTRTEEGSYWFKTTGVDLSTMGYLKAGEPMMNMQIPLKEFEGNDAIDVNKDQNPAPRM